MSTSVVTYSTIEALLSILTNFKILVFAKMDNNFLHLKVLIDVDAKS